MFLVFLRPCSAASPECYFIANAPSFILTCYLCFSFSVVGFSFDLLTFNIVGYIAYSVYNLAFYYSPVIKVSIVSCLSVITHYQIGIILVFWLPLSSGCFLATSNDVILRLYFSHCSRRETMKPHVDLSHAEFHIRLPVRRALIHWSLGAMGHACATTTTLQSYFVKRLPKHLISAHRCRCINVQNRIRGQRYHNCISSRLWGLNDLVTIQVKL